MKRAIFLVVVVVVLLTGAVSASAQLRLDMDVNLPLFFGSSSGDAAWNHFVPFPNGRLAWQFGGGLIDGGVGARAFTFIIENILYPEGYIELNIEQFTFSFNVGGFAFLEFGLLSDALSSAGINNLSGFHGLILPDLNAAWRVNDWFRLGGGVFMIAPFGSDMGGVLNNLVYSFYIDARFVILFK